MLHLSADNHFFAFSKDHVPVLRINSSDRVRIQTMDCFSNQIRREEDTLETIDWERVNPATGPIFIEDAQPGDVLKVTIEKIDVGPVGVMATGEGMGVFGSYFKGMSKRLIPIEGEWAVFNERLRFRLNKMIGVIGVAPSKDPVNCGTPGSHGGNMDTKLIGEGSSVLLPVFTQGALFGTGDVHAAMGDGEVGVTGVEIDALLTLNFEVIKGMQLNNPMVETRDVVSCIASAENLEEAALQAARDMYAFLLDKTGLAGEDLAMLLSAVGDLQVSQIVDPLKTARFTLDKQWIEALS
ncbi:MAG TPA: acetamidase/formamidase family protein [Thermotogota bacterium]|nr:acetamidase/formamidase family protein [Thermotogota bacterium]